MSGMRYLIDTKYEVHTTVTVVADSLQEAEERVLRGEGEPGQQHPGDIVIVSIRLLDDDS